MKQIVGWAAVSAIFVTLAGACEVTVTDDADAGGFGGSSGSGGSAGSGGTAGSAGSAGTSGSSGSSGSSGTTDAGTIDSSIQPETGPISRCETCATQRCGNELVACRGDSGCGAEVAAFLTCLTRSDFDTCATDFAVQVGSAGQSQSLANDLATCVDDPGDAGTTCVDLCAADGG